MLEPRYYFLGRLFFMKIFLVLFLTIFLLSCAKKEEVGDESVEGFNTDYKVTVLTSVGSIRGSVNLSGDLPPQVPIEVQRDQAVCGVSHPNPSLPSASAIKGCIIWLEGIKEGKDFDFAKSPKMDQTGCEFVPHVLLIKQGSTIVIHNSDDALHNFHVMSKDVSIVNEAQPAGAPPREVTFTKSGIHHVGCDVHPWMRGFIMVASHPYFAMTDATGSFTIENVPPGKYLIKMWRDNWNVESLKNPAGKIVSYKTSPNFEKQDSVTVGIAEVSEVHFSLP